MVLFCGGLAGAGVGAGGVGGVGGVGAGAVGAGGAGAGAVVALSRAAFSSLVSLSVGLERPSREFLLVISPPDGY